MNTFARVPTGLSLVAAPLLLLVGFTALSVSFHYPAVLRFAPAEILVQFRAGGPSLVAQWYAMVLASLLFIPAGLLLHPLMQRVSPRLAPLSSGLIVLGGLVNALGFLRWPFLVPQLAAQYAESTSGAARDATVAVFSAFHAYAGQGIGEHLGFAFLGGWLLWRGGVIPGWLGWVWMMAGAGTLVGLLEPLGLGFAAPVNALASSLGMLAVLLSGVLLLRRPRAAFEAERAA